MNSITFKIPILTATNTIVHSTTAVKIGIFTVLEFFTSIFILFKYVLFMIPILILKLKFTLWYVTVCYHTYISTLSIIALEYLYICMNIFKLKALPYLVKFRFFDLYLKIIMLILGQSPLCMY